MKTKVIAVLMVWAFLMSLSQSILAAGSARTLAMQPPTTEAALMLADSDRINNPCLAKHKEMNPCQMKNPCHAKGKEMNPCHMKNPCHARGKAMNPCHMKNPCHDKGKGMNPCHMP